MKSEEFIVTFYCERVINNLKLQYKLKFFTLHFSLFT